MFKKKHVLRDESDSVLDLATDLMQTSNKSDMLSGKIHALLFFELSTHMDIL
jgi:aspartate carbamoyltransferase catalytic subunit